MTVFMVYILPQHYLANSVNQMVATKDGASTSTFDLRFDAAPSYNLSPITWWPCISGGCLPWNSPPSLVRRAPSISVQCRQLQTILSHDRSHRVTSLVTALSVVNWCELDLIISDLFTPFLNNKSNWGRATFLFFPQQIDRYMRKSIKFQQLNYNRKWEINDGGHSPELDIEVLHARFIDWLIKFIDCINVYIIMKIIQLCKIMQTTGWRRKHTVISSDTPSQ